MPCLIISMRSSWRCIDLTIDCEHLQNPESSQSLWALRELYSRQPCLATFKAHADMVWGTAFSPDGKLLVSAGEDSKIKSSRAGRTTTSSRRSAFLASSATRNR